MPRLPRYVLPGQPQHIIQRGNNHCDIFRNEEDFGCFHHCLKEACKRQGCHIHAYVLMTNHIHLLLTPDAETSIPKAMQAVGRRYVQFFNKKYGRTGTLWEGRYKATLIDTENYFLTCSRYIELNPVRANMVKQPGDYHWSSYHANAHGSHDMLVEPHPVYLALHHNATSRQSAYRSLFQTDIDDKALMDMRHATQKGWVLGSDRFKVELQEKINRRVRPSPRGGDRRSIRFRNTKP